MTMSNLTLTDIELLDTQAGEAEVAFEMDEDTFRAFYDRTARPLWAYLARMTGDPNLADDLLQETYYRFLRISMQWEGEAHRRAYLFRIATNLVRDGLRRARRHGTVALGEERREAIPSAESDVADAAAVRTDLQRAMSRLRPRDRALLWLAYGQGQPHAEIAEALGLKRTSIKLLLFRARRRLADLLGRTRSDMGGKAVAPR